MTEFHIAVYKIYNEISQIVIQAYSRAVSCSYCIFQVPTFLYVSFSYLTCILDNLPSMNIVIELFKDVELSCYYKYKYNYMVVTAVYRHPIVLGKVICQENIISINVYSV